MSQEDRKHESSSEAHQLFRSEPGHSHHTEGKAPHVVPGVVAPGSTGVLYVTERATANGFSASNPDWCNCGQGAPETGPIPGIAPRPTSINLEELSAEGGADVNEYAPASGVPALREAVAKMYNELYRKGKESQYTSKNVCIVPGGRAGLTRVSAVIGDVLVAYTVPEYTCYDQILGTFKRIVPLPSILREEDAYHLNPDKLEAQIDELGLSAVMLSNPHNPTGQVIHGDELDKLVQISRKKGTTLILDEFYDQYIYEEGLEQVSAAEFIEDVNDDNVVLIGGLTKGFRLPGWRVCWVLGPETLIRAIGQSGGFIDGGASHILQRAALPLLEPERVKSDRKALQAHFKTKRDHVLRRLREIGFEVKNPPNATFYIWLDLRQLPAPLSSGMVFFEELLKERTIVVPGQFFDVNPSNRRNLLDSPCDKFVRISFGPPLEQLDRGLDAMQRVVEKVRQAEKDGKDLHEMFGKDLKTTK
ncbi:pyridoxal phosphate-dependent aminotransferase [Sporobolomyces koalae]|uniref:pyridoxal phosphate-dependent aminotransferase n=1 Tax=Sporobolomyces koalae TaxID=500713 RepID=UPI00316CB139